jgi:hypothetical protein
MAERNWTKPLFVAALLLFVGAGTVGFAQSAKSGTLLGKLTDLYSKPLEGVAVTLRNEATGAEARTTTTKNGDYRFSGLLPGEYTLEADSPRLGRGHVEGIAVTAGHEARVQTAMEFVHTSSAPLLAAAGQAQPGTSPREIPQVTATLADAPLTCKSLEELTLTGFSRRVAPREIPETSTPPVNAVIAETPLHTLPLTARVMQKPEPQPSSVAALPVAAGTATQPAPEPQLAAAQAADPRAAAVSSTVTAAQLQALPLTGRNWESFVLDTPPATDSQIENGQASSRISGGSPSAVTVDGSSIRLAFGGTGAGALRGRGASLIGPGAGEASVRSVQSMATDAMPDGSATAGRRTNVETERGANGLHGQASLFNRQNLWGAQNPFTQWVKETAPATLIAPPTFTPEPYTPSDRETTWDVGAGGRIRRGRIFWFAALGSNQRNDPAVSTVKHPDNFFVQPSNDQMQVLSAQLGLNSTNPVAAGLAAYSKLLETLDGLLGPAPRTSSQSTGFGRLDWQAAERHRFTLEGTGARLNSPGGGLTRTSETYGTHSLGSSRASEEWLMGRWEAFLTPNLLAVTQGSVGRQIQGAPPEKPSAYEQTLNINSWGQLPQIVVDSRYGFTMGNPARFGPGSYPDEHLYDAQEQVDWIRGSLLVKAGFDLSHNQDATSLLRNQTGTYYYSSVENFASDALAFAAFGLSGQLDPMNQHNCDQTGKAWRDSAGTLHGLGYLPCYSYYSQTMGPTNWWLSTNDWASYVTAQWQPKKQLALSLAIRWEREQMPPPIAALRNPDLPQTETLPSPGNEWGPRASLAWGTRESHWPVLRLGYGMYFDRTQNATLETALTQTGSLKGDLNFFMRPTDNLNTGGAPPFPYVLSGQPASVVKPGAVEFAPQFRNGEVHQAVAAVEETLPGRVQLTASAVASLGRRLPITLDANIDPSVNPRTVTYAVVDGNGAGPLKTQQITVPFYASWPSAASSTGFAGRINPSYQQVTEIVSRANSTYEAAMLGLTRYGRGGLALRAHYTYAHAMDWNPNESAQVSGPSVLDPTDFRQEYGTSNQDVRHSGSVSVIWEPKWKLRDWAGKLGNGWMLSGIGTFHSGLPYSMRTGGSLAKEFDATGAAIVALSTGMNGYGGDNRVYGVGRNTYRYPATWKADLRMGKKVSLGRMRQLELLAESFNLFNHQNVTELETTGYSIQSGSVNGSFPTLNFLTGLKTGQTEFGQPLNINATNFYRQRQLQFGVRLRF